MKAWWRTALWQQFGAAIDMLDGALAACPDELWHVRVWGDPYATFWNIAYHTLFWLDLYLSGSMDGFLPPAPFTLDELDPEGRLPDRPYTRAELQAYLAHARNKCQATVEALTDEQAGQRCGFARLDLSVGELLLYTMRHVQEHAAQLQLVIGQHGGMSPGWVGQARRGHRSD